MASEIYKARVHRGETPNLFHLRETRGLEVDLLTESASGLVLVEVKSGATLAADFFGPLRKLAESFAQRGTKSEQRLVYGGC